MLYYLRRHLWSSCWATLEFEWRHQCDRREWRGNMKWDCMFHKLRPLTHLCCAATTGTCPKLSMPGFLNTVMPEVVRSNQELCTLPAREREEVPWLLPWRVREIRRIWLRRAHIFYLQRTFKSISSSSLDAFCRRKYRPGLDTFHLHPCKYRVYQGSHPGQCHNAAGRTLAAETSLPLPSDHSQCQHWQIRQLKLHQPAGSLKQLGPAMPGVAEPRPPKIYKRLVILTLKIIYIFTLIPLPYIILIQMDILFNYHNFQLFKVDYSSASEFIHF